jgi:hypothetical protein
MAKDQEVLTGEVASFDYANGNRPAKFIVDGPEGAFELTVYPENGVPQPWDEESKLPAFMNGLPPDIVGVSIQAIVDSRVREYNGVKQYKPTKITVLGSNPSPKQAARAAPVQAPRIQSNPADRDTMIVDQVIFKGAIELLLKGDVTVAKAVEDAILAWESVRARHLPKPEGENPEEDFGSL